MEGKKEGKREYKQTKGEDCTLAKNAFSCSVPSSVASRHDADIIN